MTEKRTLHGVICLLLCLHSLTGLLGAGERTCTITVTVEKEAGDVVALAEFLRQTFRDRLGYKIEKWKRLETKQINWQHPQVSLKVEPGVYKVHLRCDSEADSEPFTLQDYDSRTVAFRLGTVKVEARQADGYVDESAELYEKHVEDEAGLERVWWKHIEFGRLKKGVISWDVFPGPYKVKFLQEVTEVRVKAVTTETLRFDVGYLHIIASLQKQGEVLSSYGEVHKRAEKEYVTGYKRVKPGEWRKLQFGNIMKNGERRMPVLPGEYKVVVEVRDRKRESRVVTVGPREVKEIVI